jgi:sulfur-oxidizing protein SoxY
VSSRRQLLQLSGAALATAAWPVAVFAEPGDVDASIAALFGGREIREGRVTVELPPISENGYSVPLSVAVESPMTAADHVVRIAVFAEKNPLPDVARFELGANAGVAHVRTRIRLADSQRIRAIAEMSDGSLWTGYAFTIVTLAACVL